MNLQAAELADEDDCVAAKRAGYALWRSVVKENEHRRALRSAPVLTP